ncbi:MAG: hypothetical protein ACQETH_09725 [Candidatus Rifleibacteriota bacterium]
MVNRRGIALILVLSLSLFMLILGMSYMRNVSQVSTSNPKRLKQIQADFFARGIQRLAVLKFKALPADFYHAYRYKIADEKKPRDPDLPVFDPSPYAVFLGDKGSILQDRDGIADPVPIEGYNTRYIVNSSSKFDHDMIDIVVNVQMEDYSQNFTVTYDASRSLVLPPPPPAP